jgi:nucleotide-binding universal stress UspA family protein
MANRIVCGIDASSASGCAAAVAARLSRELGAQALLVHVEPSPSAPVHGLASIAQARERGRLRALVDGHEFLQGTRVRVEFGDPGKELLRYADLHDAELIVVGARGPAGALPPLGSVATRLIRRAPCPVVVVPPALSLPFAPSGVRSVVCAVQDAKRDADVLGLGGDLVARLGGGRHAVHASHSTLMHPAAVLLTLAQEMCADLIVVASEDRTQVVHRMTGPVAGWLAASASCPVIVLPPNARLGAGSGHYEVDTQAA